MVKRIVFTAIAGALLVAAARTSAFAQLSPVAEWATHAANEYQVQANITYLTASGYESKLDVYRRRDVQTPQPTLVFYHGGGWVIGDLESHDHVCRALANGAQCIVAAVDYRLAPEAPYPAAWDDAADAYGWVTKMAERLGGSATDICVGGDSAGGNLAIAVTRRRQAAGEPLPVCQLLYYPAVDNRPVDEMRRTYLSSRQFGEGFGLDRAFMEYVLPRVFQQRDRKSPEISPLFAASVAGMPPTFFGVAGFDPLRDSQRAYALRLIKAGDTVSFWDFPTIAHGFLQMTAVSPAAQFAASASARLFGRFAREAATARALRQAQ